MIDIIAIDHGNAQIKTPNNVFVSGLTTNISRPAFAENVLQYKNTFYTLSNKRISYMMDKTKNDDFFVLTLFAILKDLEVAKTKETEMDLILSVGLPLEHRSQKDCFRNYFLKKGKNVEFNYNNKNYKFHFKDVLVFPQSYAAASLHAEDIKSYNASSIFIVDIGGYTVDILMLKYANRRIEPDWSVGYSLESGVIKMMNNIRYEASSTFGITLNDEHIVNVLNNVKTILEPDVIKLIRFKAQKHVENLILDIREREIDLRTNPVLFIGGGAVLLKKFLSKSDMIAKMYIEPDVKANARGYYELTKSALAQAKKKA